MASSSSPLPSLGILDDQSDLVLPTMSGHESDSPDDDDTGTYYFESDHVALKGNPDYQLMLRTVAVLEAQRIQVLTIVQFLYIF